MGLKALFPFTSKLFLERRVNEVHKVLSLENIYQGVRGYNQFDGFRIGVRANRGHNRIK